MFEKKEKIYIDPKTGKASWITTKQGLIKDSRTPVYDKFKPQIRAKQNVINKQRWVQRKKTYNKVASGVDSALDWLEGTSKTKTAQSMPKPVKKQYIIKAGVAYPVYKHPVQKPIKHKHPVKKKTSYNAWDFKL